MRRQVLAQWESEHSGGWPTPHPGPSQSGGREAVPSMRQFIHEAYSSSPPPLRTPPQLKWLHTGNVLFKERRTGGSFPVSSTSEVKPKSFWQDVETWLTSALKKPSLAQSVHNRMFLTVKHGQTLSWKPNDIKHPAYTQVRDAQLLWNLKRHAGGHNNLIHLVLT